MAEVEKLADRALVLVRGRIAALGSPRQLTNQGDNKSRVSMLTRDGCLATRETGECQDSWKVDAEGYVKIRTDRPGPVLANLIAAIDEAGDEILDLRVERPVSKNDFSSSQVRRPVWRLTGLSGLLPATVAVLVGIA